MIRMCAYLSSYACVRMCAHVVMSKVRTSAMRVRVMHLSCVHVPCAVTCIVIGVCVC